jgi:IclR family KDG regulon transcriptional repressor
MRLLTDSSAGIALMSQMSDAQIDKICRYVNYYELNPKGRVDSDEVLKHVLRVREQGCCFVPYRPTPATASIAFPLGDRSTGSRWPSTAGSV